MLQLERVNDPEEYLKIALDAFSASLWTSLPGIVNSYNAVQGTCVIAPAIQGRVRSSTGVISYVNLPLLVDVPVVYMGGGAFVATFPIQPGDEALVIFADRCIDGWWQSGGIQRPPDLRVHDLSDGFALIGSRSLAKSIPNVSTTTAQFRSLDGSTYFEVAPGQIANVVAPGGVNITGPVNITGNLNVTGTVTATQEGQFNNVEVSQHEHTGVQTGGGTSGPPVG